MKMGCLLLQLPIMGTPEVIQQSAIRFNQCNYYAFTKWVANLSDALFGEHFFQKRQAWIGTCDGSGRINQEKGRDLVDIKQRSRGAIEAAAFEHMVGPGEFGFCFFPAGLVSFY